MNAQDVQKVISVIPASASALRAAMETGQIRTNPSGPGFRFEASTGTLDDSTYDLFRPTNYLLSCVSKRSGTEVAYITRKLERTPASGTCYHATKKTNLVSIRAAGLIIGRNVPAATPTVDDYPDSKQYIHASLTADRATEFWYYDRLGNYEAGVVLEIDLNAAGYALLADPRSEDGIIQATHIDPRHITQMMSLQSVADMRARLEGRGWTFRETEITSTVSGKWRGLPASTSGYTLPGAWRRFFVGVEAGTLP